MFEKCSVSSDEEYIKKYLKHSVTRHSESKDEFFTVMMYYSKDVLLSEA